MTRLDYLRQRVNVNTEAMIGLAETMMQILPPAVVEDVCDILETLNRDLDVLDNQLRTSQGNNDTWVESNEGKEPDQ